jgi:hypothetical protein
LNAAETQSMHMGAHHAHCNLVDCDLVIPKPAKFRQNLQVLRALRPAADVFADQALTGPIDVCSVHSRYASIHKHIKVLNRSIACCSIIKRAPFMPSRQLPIAFYGLQAGKALLLSQSLPNDRIWS